MERINSTRVLSLDLDWALLYKVLLNSGLDHIFNEQFIRSVICKFYANLPW
jgi:hypothetical protein